MSWSASRHARSIIAIHPSYPTRSSHPVFPCIRAPTWQHDPHVTRLIPRSALAFVAIVAAALLVACGSDSVTLSNGSPVPPGQVSVAAGGSAGPSAVTTVDGGGTPGDSEGKAPPLPSSAPTKTAKGTTAVPATPTTPATAPSGDAFYTPPSPLPAGNPGDIIWMQSAPAPAGAQAWKVLYHSRAVDGTDIAVSGYVIAPDGRAARRRVPRPRLGAWHDRHRRPMRPHPHRPPERRRPLPRPISSRAATSWLPPITKAWARPASTRTWSAKAKRTACSIASAPRETSPTRTPGRRWSALGRSQGGHAVLETAELAAAYAPELELRGALAGGPLTELSSIVPVLEHTPYFGYLFMAGAGFDAAYHTHILDDLLTPKPRPTSASSRRPASTASSPITPVSHPSRCSSKTRSCTPT